jgi:hypothetical protein
MAVGDGGDDMSEIRLRVDLVQLACLDDAVELR